MLTMLTIEKLNLFWFDYNRLATPERFGQFVFNRTDFEVGNSYNERDDRKAYKMIAEAITTK